MNIKPTFNARLFVIAVLLCAFLSYFDGLAWAQKTVKNSDGTTTTIEPNQLVGGGYTIETTRNEKGEITKKEWKNEKGKPTQIKYITKQGNGDIRIDTIGFRPDGSTPHYTEKVIIDENGRITDEWVDYDKDGENIVKGNRIVTDPDGNKLGYDYDPVTKEWKVSWKSVMGADGFAKNYHYDDKTKEWKEIPPQKDYPEIPKQEEKPPEKLNKTALPGYEVDTIASTGLNTVSFTTPRGKINVNLTNDLAAGDSISGTVVEEPEGKNEKERSKNQGELNGYVVEVEGKQTPASEGTFACHIPDLLTDVSRTVNLWYKGKKVATTEIPISETPPETPTDFTLPTGGQQGKNLEITGPCDGTISNSDYVKVGDTTLPTLAESPRKKVVMNTSETTGSTTIKCNEQDVITECSFRNIGIQVWADKLNLRSGETTRAGTKVLGLLGIDENLPLDLVASGTIEMKGGNTQHLTITPQEVKADGTYPVDLTLTGTAPGSFGLTATVYWNNVCTNRKEIAAQPKETPPEAQEDAWRGEFLKKLQEDIDFWKEDVKKEQQWAKDADDPDIREYWEKMAERSDLQAEQDQQESHLSTLEDAPKLDKPSPFPPPPKKPDCTKEAAAVEEAWNNLWRADDNSRFAQKKYYEIEQQLGWAYSWRNSYIWNLEHCIPAECELRKQQLAEGEAEVKRLQDELRLTEKIIAQLSARHRRAQEEYWAAQDALKRCLAS